MDLNKLTHKGGLPSSPRGAAFDTMDAVQMENLNRIIKESTPVQNMNSTPEYRERPIRNAQRDKNDPAYIRGETVYLSNHQWNILKEYAKSKGLRKSEIISDLIDDIIIKK